MAENIWLEKARRYYGKEGGWDKDQLRNITAKGKITAADFKEITGEDYTPPAPTVIEQKMDATQETQLIMMEAMADQYEEQLERELNNMEVQATIYEAILELGGNV